MGKHSGESQGAPCAGFPSLFWRCSAQPSDCCTPAGQGIRVQAAVHLWKCSLVTSWGLHPALLGPPAPGGRSVPGAGAGSVPPWRSWPTVFLQGFTLQPCSVMARCWWHGCDRVSALLLQPSAASAGPFPCRTWMLQQRRGQLGAGQRPAGRGASWAGAWQKIASRCPLPQKRFVAG